MQKMKKYLFRSNLTSKKSAAIIVLWAFLLNSTGYALEVDLDGYGSLRPMAAKEKKINKISILDMLKRNDIKGAIKYLTAAPDKIAILNAELEKPLEGKEETQQIHDRLVKLYAGLFLWWARLPPDVRAKSAIQPKWHYLPEMLGKDGITLTPDVGVEIKNRGTYGGIIRQNLLHKIGFGAALNKAGVTPEEKAWLDTLPLDSIRFDDLDQLFMQARNWTAENDRPKIELLVRLYQACRKIDKQMNSYSIHHAEEAREGIPKFATPGFLLAFERDYLPPGDIERCAGYKRLQEIICVARIIDDNITDKFYGAGPVIDQIKEVITKYPAVIDEIASEFAEVVLAEPKQTQKFCRILYALDNMTIWNDFVFTLNAKGGYLDFKHGKRYDIKFTIRWSGSHAAAFPIRPSTAESARAV